MLIVKYLVYISFSQFLCWSVRHNTLNIFFLQQTLTRKHQKEKFSSKRDVSRSHQKILVSRYFIYKIVNEQISNNENLLFSFPWSFPFHKSITVIYSGFIILNEFIDQLCCWSAYNYNYKCNRNCFSITNFIAIYIASKYYPKGVLWRLLLIIAFLNLLYLFDWRCLGVMFLQEQLAKLIRCTEQTSSMYYNLQNLFLNLINIFIIWLN